MAGKKSKKTRNTTAQPSGATRTARKPTEARKSGVSLVHLALLAALAIALYANTLNSPFVWDEEPLILNNALVHDLGYYLNPQRAVGHPHYDALVSRYVSYLTFALNYAAGGDSVTGYRVVNIAIHLLNSVLAYLLVIMVINTPLLRDSALKDKSRSIALLAGALFVSHPLMTEAVTYTFQRHASLVTTFYIMTIVLYSASRQSESRAMYITSMVSAVLAMKTKENAFTLPLVVALYEFMFFRDAPVNRLKRLVPFLLTMAIVPLTMSYLGSLSQSAAPSNAIPAAAAKHIMGRAEYFYTQMPVVARYLRMLVLPYGQSLDHAYTAYSSISSIAVILSMALHLLVICIALVIWKRSAGREPELMPELKIVAFGILWFYITLSVESTFQPLQMIITEYRAYLPAAGAFLAASTLGMLAAVEIERRRPGALRAARISAIALIAVLSALTIARNSIWKTELGIWQDAAAGNAQSARPALHVGLAYEKLKDYDEALKAYQRAAELEPDHYMAHYDMGVIYNNKGMYDMAEAAFRRAIEIKPDHGLARNNLAAALMRTGKIQEAERELRKAIELAPVNPNPYFNLALLLLNSNRYSEAEPYLLRLSSLMPASADVTNKLAVVYRETGRSQKARDTLNNGLARFPGDFHLLLNLATLEDLEGNIQEAEELYLRTLSRAPREGYAPFDALAALYIRSGRNAESLPLIEKGLQRDPSGARLLQLRSIAQQGLGTVTEKP